MPVPPPDLVALALLVDVERTGSIGAAGRAHDMTQQGASERLRGLEVRTGLTLVRRSPSGSSLTEAGRLVAEWGSRLLAQADELEHAVATLRGDQRRGLRVAASMTVAEYLLPGWLVRLRHERGTAVNLTATNSETVVRLVESGEVDLGFVEDDAEHRGLASLAITSDELVLVAHPEDGWAERSEVSAQEVADRPLTHREAGSGTRSVVERALAERGLGVAAPEVELSTTAAVRGAVVAGSAPAFLSRLSVDADLAAGRLVQVRTDLDVRRLLTAIWVGAATAPAGPIRDLLAIATHPRDA